MSMAICYGRISREENTLSLADQSQETKTYANRKALVVFREMQDKVSGYADLLQHENLINMLNLCVSNGIKDIIVTDLSRLTRSVRDGILLLDWLHREGIRLHLSRLDREIKELDYLSLISEFAEAERYYFTCLQKEAKEIRLGDSIKGKSTLGYERDPSRKNVLIKKDIPGFDIGSIFRQALEIREQHPRYSMREISKQIDSNTLISKKIYKILGNPLYTGRNAPKGTKDLAVLTQYKKIHEAYISEEEFILINGGKTVEEMDFNDIVFCKNCYVGHSQGQTPLDYRLHKNDNNLRCKKCGRTISILKLKKQLPEMCQKYIFEPDAFLAFNFANMSVITQLDELLKQIAKTGNLQDSGQVLNYPASQLSAPNVQYKLKEASTSLIKNLKKYVNMNMNNYNIGLLYHIYQVSKDGRAVRDLLKDCFDGVFVVFGQVRVTRVEPVTVKPGVMKATNPFTPDEICSELQKVDKVIKKQSVTIRSLLASNPFLTDFLSMRIIDHNFHQWDEFVKYVMIYKLRDPLSPP